jgi:hydrogenase expression/formation protein HypE
MVAARKRAMRDATESLTCAIPSGHDAECITLAYGEGGRLSRLFIQERILARFDDPSLRLLGDAAILQPRTSRIAVTTDSYTVAPLFFPGGDIGRLAVNGTLNDLAVSGAAPRWLTLSLIIEEGLRWETLDAALDGARAAASEAGVAVVAGDTKVVPRGAVDGLFLNVSGIGERLEPGPSGIETAEAGDVVIVTGPIGQHGAAILCARGGYDFQPTPESDCASLAGPLERVWLADLGVRAARDATRGGVAAVLHEWSIACRLGITISESALPVTSETRAVCELLGLDPIHLACEGACLLIVAAPAEDRTIDLLRDAGLSQARKIGEMTSARRIPVRAIRSTGREVPIDDPAGAPLPRIC